MLQPLFSNQKFPLAKIIEHIRRRPFSYFIAFEILISGLWIESVYQEDYFQRSGAVVALYALGLLWLWLRYSQELDLTSGAIEGIEKQFPGGDNTDTLNVLSRVQPANPNLDQLTLALLTSHIVRMATTGPKTKSELAKIGKSLGYSQIEVAAIGTIVWAFGDLLSPLILQ